MIKTLLSFVYPVREALHLDPEREVREAVEPAAELELHRREARRLLHVHDVRVQEPEHRAVGSRLRHLPLDLLRDVDLHHGRRQPRAIGADRREENLASQCCFST